jgi:hypothetical protein
MQNENGFELAVEGGSNILSMVAMPLGGKKYFTGQDMQVAL